MIMLERNDLISLESTHKVDDAFLSFLSVEDKEKVLLSRSGKPLSDCDLLSISKLLQSFLVLQFEIEEQFEQLQYQEHSLHQSIIFHQSIVKPAARRLKISTFDPLAVDKVQALLDNHRCSTESEVVRLWQTSSVSNELWIEWSQFVLSERQDPYFSWSLFQLPERIDYDRLVTAKPIEARSDFSTISPTLSQEDISKHVHYCIVCHHKENDSCSKGLKSRKSDELKISPLGRELSGCPLNQKISEMHELRQSNNLIAALSVIMRDNPLCFLTGDRICNDCMAACIYQKFTPVDTPSVESDTLKKVVSLPFGAEIYLLLARWNPLRPEGYIHSNNQQGSLAVVGMGPAGIAMCYYGLMEGASVLGLDGLPIDIVADAAEPIESFSTWSEQFNQGRPLGFGGVADYGITVRWDKRFLALAWVLLSRFKQFRLLGNVRLGGSITLTNLKNMGFDQVVLATGAGLPQALMIQTLQGMFFANEFLMRLHLSGILKKNLDDGMSLPIRVIGGGLTAVDAATEAQVAYIKWVQQVDFWISSSQSFKQEVYNQISQYDLKKLDAWVQDGHRIRLAKGCHKTMLSVVLNSGGVSILYRRKMQDSPAYKTNFIELEKALEQGIQYIEQIVVYEAVADEYGFVSALKCEIASEQKLLSTQTVLIATGSKPNVAYYYEHRHEIQIERGFYKRKGRFHLESELMPEYVSVIGDLHPEYHGSVVKALASAKDAAPSVISQLKERVPICLEHVVNHLQIKITNIQDLGCGLLHMTLTCHHQMPIGTYLNVHVMTEEGVRNQMSAVVWGQDETQVFALMDRNQDGVEDLLAGRVSGVMGPSGTRILPKNTVNHTLVFADRKGLLWALVIAAAGKQVGVAVDLYTNEQLSTDLLAYFNSLIRVSSWASIKLPENGDYDLYYCVSAEIMKQCQESLAIKAKSIYGMVHGSMMCALKGICGQCIQWQMGPNGRTKAVYACSWPNQPIELIDVDHLAMRQKKAPLGKKLNRIWRAIKQKQSLMEG